MTATATHMATYEMGVAGKPAVTSIGTQTVPSPFLQLLSILNSGMLLARSTIAIGLHAFAL